MPWTQRNQAPFFLLWETHGIESESFLSHNWLSFCHFQRNDKIRVWRDVVSALQKAIRRKWHGCFIAREKALNNASRLRSDTNNESLQEQYYFFIQRVRLVGSSCHYDKDQRLCLVIQALICKNMLFFKSKISTQFIFQHRIRDKWFIIPLGFHYLVQ